MTLLIVAGLIAGTYLYLVHSDRIAGWIDRCLHRGEDTYDWGDVVDRACSADTYAALNDQPLTWDEWLIFKEYVDELEGSANE